MKHRQVAAFSLLGQSVKLLSGPITLLVISDSLTSEQMVFYFSFFNVIALQQILEMGLGFTIKQFISHAYVETDNAWTSESIKKIKSYFKFSLLWFSGIFIFIVFGIGMFGFWFFSSYEGNINWDGPWFVLVIVTAVITLFTPILLLIEGCQKQEELYKSKLVSGVVMSITLCSCMLLGLDLYSIAISMLVSNVVLYLCLSKSISNIFKTFKRVEGYLLSNKYVFIELWPMLYKISITWITGYFFWNSFNLIAFKELSPDIAGKFAFTLGLARAGYGIAESVVSAQSTIYAHDISIGKVNKAKQLFRKSQIFSMLLLILGYLFYVVFYFIFPNFYVFDKTLEIVQSIEVFLYFILLLPVVLEANFCRCFKGEPYMWLSLFCNTSIPIVFYVSVKFFDDIQFITLIPFSIVFIIWSKILYSKST
jgi:hypothetical protein